MSLGNVSVNRPGPAFRQDQIKVLNKRVENPGLESMLVEPPKYLPASTVRNADGRLDYMPSYKPDLLTKTRAFLANIKNVGGETIGGAVKGLAGGGVAAGVAWAINKAASSKQVVQQGAEGAAKAAKAFPPVKFALALLAGATAGSALISAINKPTMGQTINGAANGAGYGLLAGIPMAVAAGVGKALEAKFPAAGRLAKPLGIMAFTTIGGSITGGAIGKMIANRKVSNIFMEGGAVNNLIGKKNVKTQPQEVSPEMLMALQQIQNMSPEQLAALQQLQAPPK